MAARPSDVLAVEALQAAAHIRPRLRVVPLFETAADLRNAGATLRGLLANSPYRDRIAGHQEVMLGYSDSAKDAGRTPGSRCFTGAAVRSAAAGARPTSLSDRSPRGRSRVRCA